MSTLHTDLLGTTVEIHMEGRWTFALHLAQRRALRTIRAQSKVFNIFDPNSDISRLRAEPEREISSQLRSVVTAAENWRRITGGAFDPNVDGQLNLNAIAKGYIVDQASRRASRFARKVIISGGGDIRHLGAGSVTVGIEDPLRPYDNVAPFRRATISNQGLATSGTARRGKHVIDPRTGQPTDHIASASVIAEDAVTADVLATALTVLSVEDGLQLISEHRSTACLIVEQTGRTAASPTWPDG
ncbi:MAG: FAD:protein FMN transferase [Acidimicrobiales bacterium]|nr:FAD:protein FMN transferase [Acidimicrobiales bacterium]